MVLAAPRRMIFASSGGTGSASGDYYQVAKGQASFTAYDDCHAPSCGQVTYGYSAAISQRSFGASSGSGDACGRCFRITETEDPSTPDWKGPFKTITVIVNDLCPYAKGEDWCGQSASQPLNNVGAAVHFDLCVDSGAAAGFFTAPRGSGKGYYEEVSCEEWKGSIGEPLWGHSCMAPRNAPNWPAVACGNTGTAPQ
ncbi:glycoside hydrolase family 45 protein [Lactifluus volemus]|nr:glycoside hydrolase family 45 protein [Lactifluus volemus]